MILQMFILFVIPLVVSLWATPHVIRLAGVVGAIDQPNERKVHTHPIPRFGGVAIYFSFFVSLLIALYLQPAMRPFFLMNTQTSVMLVCSLTMVLILGIWDDIKSVTAGKKFIGQCLAAMLVYFAGFRISSITHPFQSEMLNLGLLDFPATVIWIVGVTNAFNLIDGLDGLASGVAFIVSITICIISFVKGDATTAVMALLLAGAVLGFLRYNFHNAKIFLGDSGSLFIGFLLAILSMRSSTKGSAAFSLLVPLLTLGLPIMDTMLSMTRRFLRSVLPENGNSKSFFRKMTSIFHPDRGHIHHQLIARGLSHRSVVLVLYIVSCLFGIGAFAVTLTNDITVTPILFTIGIATFIGVSQLRYNEMALLRNGLLLPIYEWPVINSSFFQGFLDLGFIVIAYSGAYFLTSGSMAFPSFDHYFLKSLMITCGIRLSVFYMSGLYKSCFKQLGMGDLLKIFKAVVISVVLTWTLFAFMPAPWNIVNRSLVILDFYFLLSLVLGTRISFHILNYFSKTCRERSGVKKILIYGANTEGLLLIQQVLNDQSLNFCPIGFLDSDPKLEGKHLNGYPIFGGHWKLPKILEKFRVDEIILSNKLIMPEELARIKKIARHHGVVLRHFRLLFEQLPLETGERLRDPYSIRLMEEDSTQKIKVSKVVSR